MLLTSCEKDYNFMNDIGLNDTQPELNWQWKRHANSQKQNKLLFLFSKQNKTLKMLKVPEEL